VCCGDTFRRASRCNCARFFGEYSAIDFRIV